jgi:hypothetical protein
MASSRSRRRRCRFCRELFFHDPRLKERQIACSKPECQRLRKKANQEDWLARHPGYFSGRYFNTKTWRQEHPEFQRQWRKEHPEARAQDNERRRRSRELARVARAEIQDSISLQEPVA